MDSFLIVSKSRDGKSSIAESAVNSPLTRRRSIEGRSTIVESSEASEGVRLSESSDVQPLQGSCSIYITGEGADHKVSPKSTDPFHLYSLYS